MIIGQKFNASMFYFHKEGGEFSQELSSLNNRIGALLNRLYDDACDEGFVMVSDRTGAEVPFYLTDVEKSDEGEILCWNFKSASLNRNTKDLIVTVFND